MFKYKTFLFLSAMLLSAISYAKTPSQPTITVEGQAILSVPADKATIFVNIESKAKDQVEAKNKVEKNVSDLITKIVGLGVEENEIIAESLNVHPEYNYEEKKQTLVGYIARRYIIIPVTNLTNLNNVVSEIVKINDCSINNIQYSLIDKKPYISKVRELAVKNSLDQAKELAAAYNAKVVKVWQINYRENYELIAVQDGADFASPRLMSNNGRAMKSNDNNAFYNPQKIRLEDNVTATFVIDPQNLTE